jgi:hypothetical protein
MEHYKYIMALGLVSTCKPDMIIDIDDPIGMMTQVCDEFDRLRIRNAELEAKLDKAASERERQRAIELELQQEEDQQEDESA